MFELRPEEYASVRPLFQGCEYSLSIRAVMEGTSPGRIFVDRARDPRTALALTVEGYFLVGAHDDPRALDALRQFLRERIFTGEIFVNGDESMSLAVHPETWEARLPELIPTHEVEKIDRYHYLCSALRFDWRAHLPEGYAVRRVDRALLRGEGVVFPERVREWFDIPAVWGSEEDFLARGISYAVLRADEVVAWCTPDCAADGQMDVGIFVLPAHRRRGLAAVAVAATVEECFARGFHSVGWHCNADNLGSWKTAEKVGFQRDREYAYYYYMYDPLDHLAELGWHWYRRGAYDRTVQYYERVFSLRDENPDYYYHCAASAWAYLGEREKALRYLRAAVEHGWSHADWTAQQKEFAILHGLPEWDEILARMKRSAQE